MNTPKVVFEPIIYTYQESLSVFLAAGFLAAGFLAAGFLAIVSLDSDFFTTTLALGVITFLFFRRSACFAFNLRRDFFCFLFANFCFSIILFCSGWHVDSRDGQSWSWPNYHY